MKPGSKVPCRDETDIRRRIEMSERLKSDGDRDKKTLLNQKGFICVVELKGLEPLTSTMPL